MKTIIITLDFTPICKYIVHDTLLEDGAMIRKNGEAVLGLRNLVVSTLTRCISDLTDTEFFGNVDDLDPIEYFYDCYADEFQDYYLFGGIRYVDGTLHGQQRLKPYDEDEEVCDEDRILDEVVNMLGNIYDVLGAKTVLDQKVLISVGRTVAIKYTVSD